MDTFTKTKFTITTAPNIGEAADNHWLQAVASNEVYITAANGVKGGLVLTNGEIEWSASDAAGKRIDPVESGRVCGSQKLFYNYMRGQRPVAPARFGPPPPPQRDGFFPGQPSHPLSIKRRPCLVVEMGEGRKIALVPNGFPFVAEGHFLAFHAKMIDDDVVYPWVEQRLNSETSKLILDLAVALGPDYAVGYNDPGTGGTQRLFHPQVLKVGEYPVERAVRIPLADGAAFPLYSAGCLIAENVLPDTLLSWVERLQGRGVALNLLVRDRTAFVFPRRSGVGIVPEFPTGLIAFSELSGHWICSNERVYTALDEDYLRTAHRKVTLGVDEAWPIAAT